MLKVAVIGATGNVGREILSILSERNFPMSEIVALASARSDGKQVPFGQEKTLEVHNLDDFDFTGTDIAFIASGSDVSEEYAPLIAQKGCVVIDNSSKWRQDKRVPLIVPKINDKDIQTYSSTRIISNPNCSTIQMLMALKPLHDAFRIKRVIVTTFQSVSGAGQAAVDELKEETSEMCANDFQSTDNGHSVFPKQIAFNVIPHIDRFTEDGETLEEIKMAEETHKILSPDIQVHANCARVPVLCGHAEFVNIETEKPISVTNAKEILSSFSGVKLTDDYMTQSEIAGTDDVWVSRVRQDKTIDNGISFWCVSDNLRKGAALNAVQIAELLLKNDLLSELKQR